MIALNIIRILIPQLDWRCDRRVDENDKVSRVYVCMYVCTYTVVR